MNSINQVGIEATRKHLHSVLKNLGRPSAGDLAFFGSLQAYSQSAQPNSPLDFIQTYLSSLDELDQRYGDLLRRRFWKDETIRQVANQIHLSPDQVNRLQRDALNALAEVILEKEAIFREASAQALVDKLPAPNYSRLFGVEKIQNKLAGLLGSQREPWLMAVSGIGGIGKTAVVDSVIRSHAADLHYRDVIWIRTPRGGDLPIWEKLILILTRRLLKDQFATISQIQALRKLLREKPHLIVIDGLEDELDDDLLSHLQKLSNPTRILLTCRTFPVTSLDIHQMMMSEIDLKSAQEFPEHQAEITGLAGQIQPFSQSIYKVVGGNPLALKLAIGLMKTWSVENALRAIRDGKSSRLGPFFDSIYVAAWHGLSQATRKVFQAMVFAGNEGATIEQLSAVSLQTESNVREAISDLVQRSLIEVRGSIQERRYGIHNLTETFLRGRATDGSADNQATVQVNIEYWLKRIEEGSALTVIESEGGNLYRAVELGFELLQFEAGIKLLLRLHSSILTKRVSSIWVGLFAKAIPAAKSIKQSIVLLNHLGSLYWQTSQYDRALETFENAKALSQSENLIDEAISAQLGMAIIYWTQGKFTKANREAKSARKQARARSSIRFQARLSAVSGIIAQAEGKYLAADKFFLKAASHYKKDKFILAQIALNRGSCFQNKKQFRLALKQYRKAEDFLRIQRTEEKELAQIEMLRSSVFYQMGDLANSETALKRAAALIADRETDTREQAFFENSLGRVYLSLGKKKEAIEAFKSAARLWRKTENPRVELNVTELFGEKAET